MPRWTHEVEVAGRAAFDSYRYKADHVTWDWADLSDTEKQSWIDRARQEEEPQPE